MLKKLIITASLIAIVICTFLLVSRSLLYNYDVTADHAYDFSDKDARIRTLSIENGQVTLPAMTNTNVSTFLKVSVSGSLISNMLGPSLVMNTGLGREIQFFEHGASGIRYLNVSKLVGAEDQLLTLSGKRLDVDDGPAELIQFENPVLEGKRILVLAPHPDDAEIAAFGLYSGHNDVFIVTVTSGDAGAFMYDEIYDEDSETVAHYLKKGEVRTWNSLAVPLLGGVPPENIVNLGYNDARLRAMYRDKDMVAAGLYTEISDMNTFRKQNFSSLADGLVGINDWASLVGNMKYLISEIKPDIIVAPSPKLDMHSDHQYTTIAAVEALKELETHEGTLLLYTNHQVVFNERFPYGDAGAVISLPPTPRGSNHFTGLFSYPMNRDQQRSKIFALDAMNDLRLGTDYRFVGRALAQVGETFWMQITGKEESYFRRAIRSNEFFYVVDIEDIYDDAKLADL